MNEILSKCISATNWITSIIIDLINRHDKSIFSNQIQSESERPAVGQVNEWSKELELKEDLSRRNA